MRRQNQTAIFFFFFVVDVCVREGGRMPLWDNVTISTSSVSFHILSCLSVIRGEKGRAAETVWPTPLLFFTPLIPAY